MDEKKTHTVRAKPQLSVRSLADYMAASDQARRTIIRDCKYRAIARIVQHDDAKLAAAKYIRNGRNDPDQLRAEAEYIRNKLADDDFERDVNEHNADYIDRLAAISENIRLPEAELLPATQFPPLDINGVRITYRPDLLIQQVSKRTNKVKTGSLALRYAKGKALSPKVGIFQSAAILGVMKMHAGDDGEEVGRSLCLTLDAYSGEVFEAPTDGIRVFNNMKAVCATIAECWENIQKPPKAVI